MSTQGGVYGNERRSKRPETFGLHQIQTAARVTGHNSCDDEGYQVYKSPDYPALFSTPPARTNAALFDNTNRNSFLANPTQVSAPGNGRTCSLFDLGGQVYS